MSSWRGGRKELVAALVTAMRDVSGLGVLYSQAVAGRLGINSTDLECLDLVERGPVAAGTLAEATGLTTGAITGVINRLERAGFVRREADPSDRRKVLVRALPAVAEKVEPQFRPMQRAAANALASYRTEELALLLDFLSRLREAGLTAMAERRDEPKQARRKLQE
ncbi:MAG TPA: MarR family transcriptional regulator [Rhizomicrobium sp.]|nr:MarR family transcriptional regulator [Rhizomicrobium sp.]